MDSDVFTLFSSDVGSSPSNASDDKNKGEKDLSSSWDHLLSFPSSGEEYPISLDTSPELLDTLVDMNSNDPRLPTFQLVPKPPVSLSGKAISLSTNHFQILCDNKMIYKYSFQVSPEFPSKKLNRKILHLVENSVENLHNANLVFDGRSTVYSTEILNLHDINSIEIPIDGMICPRESQRYFKIRMEYVDNFKLENKLGSNGELDMLHAMDTILRQTSCDQFNVVLQSFFSTSPQPPAMIGRRAHGLGWGTVNLGIGREVCYGFYQSVVESFDMLALNIDVATTTFYRPIHMVEFLAEVLDVPYASVVDGRCLSDANRKKFSKEVRGIKVETRHCATIRRYRVLECTWKPTANVMLNLNSDTDDEREISIIDYYKSRYGINLQFMHLPCLEVGKARECILPLELCYIVAGQRCIKKLNEQQIANLIKATSRNAQERKEAVLKIRDKVGIAEDHYAVNYGLSVEKRMMKLEGRVLQPPKLLYCSPHSHRRDCVTVPNNGAWDMRGKNFYNGIEIKCWAVVCFATSGMISQQHLRSFVTSLNKVAREIGMPFLNGPSFCKYATAEQSIKVLEFLQDGYDEMQLVICVVPGKSSIYGDLKRKGDLMGLTTQCIRAHNVLKSSAHTLSNLCMKINSKLGGVNLIISSPSCFAYKKPVLFVGCQLSRNASGLESTAAPNGISICCLVGSMDGHPTRFAPTFRIQPRSLNVISEIREMMKEVILNFYTSTSYKPHRIIMYRSGVTGSNIDEVLQFELRAVREACLSIDADFQPGITIIGLDITHHTRLFATYDVDRMGNSLNVPAGTLVETGITVNNLFEFFLVSHAGIQGTSRPTKYTVMWDDNNFEGSEIHDLTYQLCHTQSRCTRSVSIPSPVYYARLVSQRVKILMSEEGFDPKSYRDISRVCAGMMFT